MALPDIDYILGLEMGQFEYAVPLSSVMPADIERVAKEYLENKQKEENERPNPDSTSTDRRPR
jgi:hypothetical protein